MEQDKKCMYCESPVVCAGTGGVWICADCLSECEPIEDGER